MIQELLGQYVQLRSNMSGSEARDEGVLEACCDRWIKLRKESETLYFPVVNVRLVKPIGPPLK